MQSFMLKNGATVVWICLGVLLLLLLRNAFFAHPVADDYCYTVRALSLGSWFEAVIHEYNRWGGRYAATALMSIFALNFDLIEDFWLIPVTLVLFSAFSFYVFFSSLCLIAGEKKDWVVWGAFGFCIYVAIMPTVSEIFYFMATGVTYTFGYGFLLIILGIVVRLSFAPLSKLLYSIYASLLFIMVFLVPGFSEVAGLLLIIALAFVVLLTFRANDRVKYIYILTLIVSMVGLAIVANAPGNEVRMANLGGGGVKWLTPFYGIYKAVGVLIITILTMYILTANRYILGLTQKISLELHSHLGYAAKKRGVLFGLFVLLLYSAVYMPSYWAAGSSAEGRTKAILYILPFILWIPTISILRSFVKAKNTAMGWILHKKPYMEKISILALFVLLLTTNIKDVVLDTVWRGSIYDSQLMDRYNEIEKAQKSGLQDLTVDKLYQMPKSLYFGDILSDPSHWRNQCYKKYFNLHSIKVSK